MIMYIIIVLTALNGVAPLSQNPFKASHFTWQPSSKHPQAAIFYVQCVVVI